jgi:DNA mismatch repair protein MutL
MALPRGSPNSDRRVRLLPDTVASQVAAGEVIERPASVLKELVENSLDAGADRIEVDFSRGGTWLIRVADNGSGMERDDALLSLERHATSKIRTAADLQTVGTFGFRGEALPSIASVSRFRLATRPPTATAATEILVEGGKIITVREAGEPPGTTVEVKNLFFNLPARRKFLRSELTETGHLVQQFQAAALAHPEVAFILRRDGKITHQSDASGDLAVRVRDLLGPDFLDQLIAAPPLEQSGLRISGLLGRPGSARADRQQQYTFLNRRPIHDLVVARGLREALAGGTESRLHPIGLLFLEMDPEEFDCNVHPAKREVRFHRPERIRAALAEFARRAWQPAPPKIPPPAQPTPSPPRPPIFHLPCTAPQTASLPGISHTTFPPPAPREESSPIPQTPIPTANLSPTEQPEPTPDSTPAPNPTEAFTFRAPLGQRYWLLENADGLVVLDLRHALERVLYEDLIRQRGSHGMPAQKLLTPVTTRVSPTDYAWISENTNLLRKAGFEAEPFGGDVIKIEAVPAGLDAWNPAELLIRLLDEIRSGNRQAAQRFLLDQVAVALSNLRSSRLDPAELAADDPNKFLRQLLACDLPYAAPGGQPTLIQWSWAELEKKFR